MSRLSLLIEWASPEVLAMVRERLSADPEKLALLIIRELNPDHVFTEQQEATIRGMSDERLRSLKQAKKLPRRMVCGRTS